MSLEAGCRAYADFDMAETVPNAQPSPGPETMTMETVYRVADSPQPAVTHVIRPR